MSSSPKHIRKLASSQFLGLHHLHHWLLSLTGNRLKVFASITDIGKFHLTQKGSCDRAVSPFWVIHSNERNLFMSVQDWTFMNHYAFILRVTESRPNHKQRSAEWLCNVFLFGAVWKKPKLVWKKPKISRLSRTIANHLSDHQLHISTFELILKSPHCHQALEHSDKSVLVTLAWHIHPIR